MVRFWGGDNDPGFLPGEFFKCQSLGSGPWPAGALDQGRGPSGGMVDAGDSKSPAARCAGSSPASGTKKTFYSVSDKLFILVSGEISEVVCAA